MTKAQPLTLEEVVGVMNDDGDLYLDPSEGLRLRATVEALEEAREMNRELGRTVVLTAESADRARTQAQRSRDEALEEAAQIADNDLRTRDSAVAAIRALKQSATPSQGEAEVEALAALEHERWAGWMRWLFNRENGDPLPDGSWRIMATRVERWARQMHTAYAELSEPEKESDRKEVRKTLSLLATLRGGK